MYESEFMSITFVSRYRCSLVSQIILWCSLVSQILRPFCQVQISVPNYLQLKMHLALYITCTYSC